MLSQLLPRANKVVNALELQTKAWLREGGVCGQNLDMVLTITTIIAITQYCFLYILKKIVSNH
jgi:hypothetical protein